MVRITTRKNVTLTSPHPDALLAVLDEINPGLTERVSLDDIKAIHLTGVAIAIDAALSLFGEEHLGKVEALWGAQIQQIGDSDGQS